MAKKKYMIIKSLDIQSGNDWYVAKEVLDGGTVNTLFATGTFDSADECERRLRLRLQAETLVVRELEI